LGGLWGKYGRKGSKYITGEVGALRREGGTQKSLSMWNMRF